ncbi:hypothetical protein crov509 [Cafeteria roenbergensis virus]|uniref:Uncharacterized protein n=1 Tax=Cafeteria roenbergensis virus (strain BV-PW1) TaxID=693272 RepID=E3T5T0_CROVB|nr:hypothetical protein crov509 [Cafeteria roenbergensis virus BV-PW1]ADO67543.1 hypothetical protein crov509 [Cafeteria roenbergensis virus BV-PW1]
MSINPIILKSADFFTKPDLVDMNLFDAWHLKRDYNHYIPDEFIQKYPYKFKINIQKIIDLIKTQKIHPKSIEAILSNFTQEDLYCTILNSINIGKLNGTKNEIDVFIEKYYKYIKWNINTVYLNENQKIKFKNIIDWNSLCYTRDLTKQILIECSECLDWKRIDLCRTFIDVRENVLLTF